MATDDTGSTETSGDGPPGAEVDQPQSHASRTRAADTTDGHPTDSAGTVESPARVLVGIPAFNEEIGIGSVVHTARRYADAVVVVDDGSTDDTAGIAAAAGAEVVSHDRNRGKGAAVQTLLQTASDRSFDAFVLLDGDGQHLPTQIPQVAQPVVAGDADLVIGSRYVDSNGNGETPVYRRVGQRVLDVMTNGSTGERLSDSQSGFRALSPTTVDRLSLSLSTDGIGVESDMIDAAARADLSIVEVPISVRYEGVDGQTHNSLRHGLRVVTFLLQLVRDRHPLVFFGVPGLFLTIVGALWGLDAILVYQSTGIFYPAKVLAGGFTTILGVLGVFCGLILNRVSNMIAELDQP